MASNAQFRDFTALEFQDRMNIGCLLGWNPNQIFYVDSNTGLSSYNGTTRAKPKATLAQAMALCADSKGDAIILLNGHAETLSTTTQGIDFSKSGVAVFGFGEGDNRPILTAGAADIPAFLVSGSNNLFSNIKFVSSSSQVAATSFLISLTGDSLRFKNCVFSTGTGVLRVMGIATNSDDHVFDGCQWVQTSTSGVHDIAVMYAGTSKRNRFINGCIFDFAAAGADDAIIKTTTGDVAGFLMRDATILGADTLAFDFNSSLNAQGDGLVQNVHCVSGAALTSIEDAIDAGGIAFSYVTITDDVTKIAGRVSQTITTCS